MVTLHAMPFGTQIAQTTCFPSGKAGGFLLVEAPAPSPGEQYLFWYAALRTMATRSKITDDRKTRSLPNRAAISHLLQIGQAANLCNFHRSYQRVLHRIPSPMPFAFPLPDVIQLFFIFSTILLLKSSLKKEKEMRHNLGCISFSLLKSFCANHLTPQCGQHGMKMYFLYLKDEPRYVAPKILVTPVFLPKCLHNQRCTNRQIS